MTQAKTGNFALIEIRERHENESIARPPIHYQFIIGRKTTNAWLNEAIIGMKLGESRTFRIPTNKIYKQSINRISTNQDLIVDIKLIDFQFSNMYRNLDI